MTLMLAGVAGPEEAEIAIAGGVDILDVCAPAGAVLALEQVANTVTAVAGRRPVSALAGDLLFNAEEGVARLRGFSAAGPDFLRIALPPGEAGGPTLERIVEAAGKTRLIAVVFANRDGDPAGMVPKLAQAGFSGIMLDIADPAAGRLLRHRDIPALAAFVRSARDHRLTAGLAGDLEEPDVPRLLQLEPDFLGFRAALLDDAGTLDQDRVERIRRLMPRDGAQLPDRGRAAPSNPEQSTAGIRTTSQRILVRDLVLPVRIGAYAEEKHAPQKVRFNVAVELDPGPAAPSGMGQVVSYDLISDGIAAIVAEGHFDFAETLAERIAAHALRQPRARRVTVKVEKLERGPAIVGVEVVAERAAPADEER